jgi:hypothetical protein
MRRWRLPRPDREQASDCCYGLGALLLAAAAWQAAGLAAGLAVLGLAVLVAGWALAR